MKTPAISVAVVMKGEDIRAGSKPILSKMSGSIAPAVAASVVIESKLMPTARPINSPSPCHHAKGITTISINIPSIAPVIASFEIAFKAPKDLIF